MRTRVGGEFLSLSTVDRDVTGGDACGRFLIVIYTNIVSRVDNLIIRLSATLMPCPSSPPRLITRVVSRDTLRMQNAVFYFES